MNRIIVLPLVFLFLFSCIWLVAQPIVFYADPLWVSAHFSPFTDGKEVKGYCALFANPIPGNYTNYKMEILDNNFKVKKRSELDLQNGARIKHSSFNGNAITITLETLSGVLIKNMVYSIDGDLLSEYEIGRKGMLSNSRVFPVPHLGFIGNSFSTDHVPVLEMRNDSGVVLWTIYPEAAVLKESLKAPLEKLSINSTDDKFLILKCEVPDRKVGEIRGNAKMFYRLYDIRSGKKINDLKKDEEERILIPYGVTVGTNAILVYGQFYFADKSSMGFNGNESQGIYIHQFDKEGEFSKEYYHPWNALVPYIKMDDDDSNTSVWLNDLLISPSGTAYLLGELYRYSKVSGVGDLVVFELQDLDTVYKVHRYAKPFEKSAISILSPNDYLFGENLKESGSFGYRYSAITSDGQAFSFVYSGEERSGKIRNNLFGVIGLNRNQELVDAKFTLGTFPERMRVLPAKNGYAAVVEYYFTQYLGVLKYFKLDI